MRGFAALMRKEFLEQRRTWRFLGTVGIFTAVALLVLIIPLIFITAEGYGRSVEDARQILAVLGGVMVPLGALVAIILSMGLLANERSAGTAGMTLSKPVTRASFVAVKHLGMVFTLFAAVLFAACVDYALALVFFGDPGFPAYAWYMAVVGVWTVFMGSITLFWSAMFRRQLLVAGIAALLFILQAPLSAIPRTQEYWPSNAPAWAGSKFAQEMTGIGSAWPGLVISLAAIVLLGIAAWVVFRRQEL